MITIRMNAYLLFENYYSIENDRRKLREKEKMKSGKYGMRNKNTIKESITTEKINSKQEDGRQATLHHSVCSN